MIKENINKIDYELKNLFDSVNITQKSRKGEFYLEISTTSIINESNFSKKIEVKVEILNKNLNSNFIEWSYYSDPTNESSKIGRLSSINTISKDIKEVLTKKFLSKDYLDSIEPIYETINESNTNLSQTDTINDILKKYNVVDKMIEEKEMYFDKPVKNLVYICNIKTSDKFKLEQELKSIGVDYISFTNETLKIKI